MKMNEELEVAFSKQLVMELGAATTYLQFAYDLENWGLTGMAAWMRAQANEEVVHGNKFAQHILDRGSRPIITDITTTDHKFENVLEVFEASLAHEEKVTASIHNLVQLADKVGDIDSRPLLNWFLEEQIEEEATVNEILDRLKIVGADGNGLLRIDQELGARNSAE